MADPDFDDQQRGTEGFRRAIGQLPAGKQPAAARLADWAVIMEKEGVVRLEWVRRQMLGMLQKLALPLDNPRDRNCLAIFTCDAESVYLQLWRSMFERHAPGSVEKSKPSWARRSARAPGTATSQKSYSTPWPMPTAKPPCHELAAERGEGEAALARIREPGRPAGGASTGDAHDAPALKGKERSITACRRSSRSWPPADSPGISRDALPDHVTRVLTC